jgi:sarcosine oxidase delta subunit
MEDRGTKKTYWLKYHGGNRYPHLVRDTTKARYFA